MDGHDDLKECDGERLMIIRNLEWVFGSERREREVLVRSS